VLALATRSDMQDRGVTIASAEEPVVDTYLDVASAAVRDAAGCAISEATDTVTVDGGPGRLLRLPGPPITAVTTVLIGGVQVTDWVLRRSASGLWRACGWQTGAMMSEVTVTYTHGYATVPADIVDLVCRIAAAALVAYRSAPDGSGLAAGDVRSERIGDYSVTYGDAGLITEMELPDYLRQRLSARFGGGAGVVGVAR